MRFPVISETRSGGRSEPAPPGHEVRERGDVVRRDEAAVLEAADRRGGAQWPPPPARCSVRVDCQGRRAGRDTTAESAGELELNPELRPVGQRELGAH
jgi:hypothetical protein